MKDDSVPRQQDAPQNGDAAEQQNEQQPVTAEKSKTAEAKTKSNKKKKKHNTWPVKAFIMSLTLSFCVNAGSEVALSGAQLWLAILLTLIIIAIGVGFDMVGTATMSCELGPFLAMASRKVKGAKLAVKFSKNADAVSSVCCDVVGDICGVVSGVCAAAIAGTLLKNATDENLNFWISVLVSAIVSTATITFKALAKNLAVSKANNILFGVCRVLSIFSKEK